MGPGVRGTPSGTIFYENLEKYAGRWKDLPVDPATALFDPELIATYVGINVKTLVREEALRRDVTQGEAALSAKC